MIPVVCLLLCSLCIAEARNSPCQPPTEYRHTLSDLSQRKVLHCSSLPAAERLPCELNGALDAQGHPPMDANVKLPHKPPSNYGLKSCKFREDNIYSLYPYAMPSSPVLNTVMEKYMTMHERCMKTDFWILNDNIYNSSNRSSVICRYLLWRRKRGGLGNRLLSLMSAFLYAIVSARVLLIDYPQYDDLFCEPFNGSTIHIPPATELNSLIGPTYFAFRDARCGTCKRSTNNICNSSLVNLHLNHRTPTREHEAISCPTGYARLRNVPFVALIENNIYLVPGFYLNPLLSPLLDILFPQRNPFHLLSRFMLAPNDAMWRRISTNLDPHASRRIGVQVREFNDNRYTRGFDSNILNCIRRKGGLMPKRIREMSHIYDHVNIYMATLVKRHLEVMASNLKVLTELTGVEFRLSFQKLDGREEHDVAHQQEALVDMWVLSFSHVLFTSRTSTFGYIATALSGTTTTLLSEEEGKGCYLGIGSDPCFLGAPMRLSCIQDEPAAFSAKDMIRKYSKVKVCPNRWGWALVPENVIIA